MVINYIQLVYTAKAYYKGDGGTVEMINGDKLQVSRNRKGEFVKRFV